MMSTIFTVTVKTPIIYAVKLSNQWISKIKYLYKIFTNLLKLEQLKTTHIGLQTVVQVYKPLKYH